jgi:hypothetical protein
MLDLALPPRGHVGVSHWGFSRRGDSAGWSFSVPCAGCAPWVDTTTRHMRGLMRFGSRICESKFYPEYYITSVLE